MIKGTFETIHLYNQRDSKENQVGWALSKLELTEEVLNINKQLEETPQNANLWMEKGLALSKSSLFREAIDAYSTSLRYDPFNALVYRHRGHRYISISMYKQAAADLELSARIDPTNWDTWYHLGLAYHLLGELNAAEAVYKRCLEITNTDDLYVAVADWYWMTLMRLGKKEEAAKLLEPITLETDPGENSSYFRRLLMYKGLLEPEELLFAEGATHPELELVTQGYGLGIYYLMNGEQEKGTDLLKKLVKESTEWAAFAYLASEAYLNNSLSANEQSVTN